MVLKAICPLGTFYAKKLKFYPVGSGEPLKDLSRTMI